MLFQQDNDPVHKAYNVMDWLERNYIEDENHPSYSPDLNPIHYLCSKLRKRLHQEYRRMRVTPGGKETARSTLAHVLPLVWETIQEDLFEKLWKLIPNRLAALLEAKGG